jgi:LacI family transcriptional regulator
LKRNVTSADVARRADVSKWTVIRAFTPDAQIAPDTRERVLRAAADLNYQPNLLARSLATKRTNLVGVLVDDFTNPYKLPTLERLTAGLQAAGMMAILININQHYDHIEALTNAKQRQLDAIVLFGTGFRDEMIDQFNSTTSANLPIYVLARDSTIDTVRSVTCDSNHALQQICGYLHARGYRRPGFMAGPRTLSTALGRRKGFKDFWKQRSIELVAELRVDRYDQKDAGAVMRDYLATGRASQRFDVLMCENDILAIGALDIARSEFGVQIPSEMAICGFDDIDLAGMHGFSLTTYRQPYEKMVDALVEMIAGQREPQTLRLPGELVTRGSA